MYYPYFRCLPVKFKIFSLFHLFFLILSFLFLSCSQKKTDANLKEKETVQEPSGQQEHVRICSSVKTVKDEYIPMLNTNVFIKTDGNSHGEELADKIEKEISVYHKLFDQYHYYYDDKDEGTVKNLAILNEYISLKKDFPSDPLLAELLKESLHLMEITDGKFNIFINPVLNLYDGYFSSFPVKRADPSSSEISKALKNVLSVEQAKKIIAVEPEKISFDFSQYSSAFSINLGGIAKGFVADRIFKKFPDQRFFLSLGSSTIICNKRNSKIGIASPYYRTFPLFQINLPEKIALSTSSTTNNYYILETDGKTIRSHILDPESGYSNSYYWAVIVLSDNATVSDALSTALFNVGKEKEIVDIIKKVRREYNCFFEACFVKDFSNEEKKVTLIMTKGFEPYVNKNYEGIGINSTEILNIPEE